MRKMLIAGIDAQRHVERTRTDNNLVTYALDYTPDETGTFDVALRIYPCNPHLPHRMDFALVKWA